MSFDVLNQFLVVFILILSGFFMILFVLVSQLIVIFLGFVGFMFFSFGQLVMGINFVGLVGGVVVQVFSGFILIFFVNQVVKLEEDDFQDF